MNYKIDHSRSARIGFPEVVFGHSKDIPTLKNIIFEISSKHQKVLVTKLQYEKYEILNQDFPKNFYDPISGIFIVGNYSESKKKIPFMTTVGNMVAGIINPPSSPPGHDFLLGYRNVVITL